MAAKQKDRHQAVESAVLEMERAKKGVSSKLTRHEVRKLDPADIKAIRDRQGMTQQEFADAFGLTISTVRNWEQGQREPEISAITLLRLIDQIPSNVRKVVSEYRRLDA